MILHALKIENWRNITRLELSDLGHPLVVLHGPNRTGKSSVAAAIRSCLLDFDHDTGNALIKDAVPWHTGLVPRVEVEFEAQGVRYKLRKKYAKGRDGEALLKRQRSGDIWDEMSLNKEASRDARRILEADNSSNGLHQLLWLTQGEIHLPVEKDLNLPLQKRFDEILGSLLMGRDFEFSSKLKRRMDVYYAPSGVLKRTSPLVDAEQELKRAEEMVLTLQSRRDRFERLRTDFEWKQQAAEELEAQLADARDQLAVLTAKSESGRERRREAEQARLRCAAAQREAETARRRVEELRLASRQRDEGRTALLLSNDQYAAAEFALKSEQAASEAAQAELTTARNNFEQQEQQRGELDDQRRLVEIARELKVLDGKLERAGTLLAKEEELRGERATLKAPDRRQLEELRGNRSEAQTRRVELKAGELQLTIRPQKKTSVDLAVDEQLTQRVLLQGQADLTRAFRQRVELKVEGFGTVEVARGVENPDLDAAARRIEDLDAEFRQRVRGYGLDAADTEVFSKLEALRDQTFELDRNSARVRDELQQILPDGREAVEIIQLKRTEERRLIWDRRPGLVNWSADLAEFKTASLAFDEQLKTLRQAQVNAQSAATLQAKRTQQADLQVQQARQEVTEKRARQTAADDRLTRCGDEDALQAVLETADQAWHTAKEELATFQQDAEEQTIEQRLVKLRAGVDDLSKRSRAMVSQRDELRGELKSGQGLHEDLVAAEADVEFFRRERDEKKLDADSQKLLWTLLEGSRTGQVQRARLAVGNRLLEWAHELGLREYGQVQFEKGYLPVGMRLAMRETPVDLQTESYGTGEQLALLVRLAVGGLLAKNERQLAILDDPLTYSDRMKHGRMLRMLEAASVGFPETNDSPAAGPLQILVLTCHPDRFEDLRGAKQVDLEAAIER